MAINHLQTFRGLDEDATVRAILEGTATATGERFFAALVENLSGALNTYSSWVTEYIKESRQLRALAFWANGQLEEDFLLDIAETPCEAVLDNARLVHYPDNIVDLFPHNTTIKQFSAVSYMGVPLLDARGRVLGNLAVMDNQPMPEEPRSLALFRIFAARASAELQRINAEAEIGKREEKYRRIVETAGESFILMDNNLVITDVNNALCRLIGARREDVIGKTPLNFATQEFRQFIETNQEDIFSSQYNEFEGTVTAKNGRDIPVLVHGSALRGDQGDIIGNMAFITDLSEQKKSLTLAGEIQKSLLPQHGLRIQGLDIAGRTAACDEIGGDYFDFLQQPECSNNHIGAVVGDVTGHGVDAALLMTTARAFLRMRASQCGGISQIITAMNRHLALDFENTGRFMTLFYVNIDPQNRYLEWVRAGHDPAIIYDPVSDTFEELTGTGLALGVDENYIYEAYRKTGLARGQIIALGTDGIWESFNSAGRMFGKERFREIIRKNAGLTADEIIDAVYRDVNTHARGLKQADDITLVIIKIDGHPATGEDWQI